ncbi:hypothetical protein K469DRAFT_724583 [Zopfia rhizophila CBS 207.26]|uniref:Uncharacterized protein n=1 Tax=Zopfia rhizophila CBS 207.26 TaxID=1314779 RepID=A0A6A6ECC7_9PEZI|nr:hypothetical protein K469DRAFT_724583 [Zopfia rhizophila CBS 207.26]
MAVLSAFERKGYYPPKPASNLPEYRVLSVSEQDFYRDILIVCYSCDQWNGNGLSVQLNNQPMIYSTQVHQKMRTADKAKCIQLHTDYNIGLQREFVANGRRAAGLLKENKSIHWHVVHGFTMVLTFTILVPSAVVCLRSGMPPAFTFYWVVRLTAVFIAFISAPVAIAKSWDGVELSVPSQITQHASLGIILKMFIVFQPALGYYHYVLFFKRERPCCSGFKITQINSKYVTIWFFTLRIAVSAMI